MILIDLTQVLIASLMAQTRGGKEPINEQLVRHICLKSLAMYRKKYFKTYGELVLADDSYNVWRKDVYPFYKANRKKTREKDDKDWNQIFDCITVVREELKYNFPYKYICISKCEADDIIGTLCEKYGDTENIMIISGDKDFQQLQRYKKVKQFSPITKKSINLTKEQAEEYLADHIIGGDTGDGVPNILSPDNCLAIGERQKAMTSKRLELYLQGTDVMDEETLRRYHRNKLMVDLGEVPQKYKDIIMSQFNEEKNVGRENLFNYFVKNKLKNLITDIQDF